MEEQIWASIAQYSLFISYLFTHHYLFIDA